MSEREEREWEEREEREGGRNRDIERGGKGECESMREGSETERGVEKEKERKTYGGIVKESVCE